MGTLRIAAKWEVDPKSRLFGKRSNHKTLPNLSYYWKQAAFYMTQDHQYPNQLPFSRKVLHPEYYPKSCKLRRKAVSMSPFMLIYTLPSPFWSSRMSVFLKISSFHGVGPRFQLSRHGKTFEMIKNSLFCLDAINVFRWNMCFPFDIFRSVMSRCKVIGDLGYFKSRRTSVRNFLHSSLMELEVKELVDDVSCTG